VHHHPGPDPGQLQDGRTLGLLRGSTERVREMAVLTREEPRAGAAIAASRLGQKRRTQIGRLLLHLVLIAVGVTFLAPFAWLLSTSLKQSGTEFAYPPQWIPHPIMWSNYKSALVT